MDKRHTFITDKSALLLKKKMEGEIILLFSFLSHIVTSPNMCTYKKVPENIYNYVAQEGTLTMFEK